MVVAGVLVASAVFPAHAEEPSLTCRLFPLVCPKPTPLPAAPARTPPSKQVGAPTASAQQLRDFHGRSIVTRLDGL